MMGKRERRPLLRDVLEGRTVTAQLREVRRDLARLQRGPTDLEGRQADLASVLSGVVAQAIHAGEHASAAGSDALQLQAALIHSAANVGDGTGVTVTAGTTATLLSATATVPRAGLLIIVAHATPRVGSVAAAGNVTLRIGSTDVESKRWNSDSLHVRDSIVLPWAHNAQAGSLTLDIRGSAEANTVEYRYMILRSWLVEVAAP